MSWFRRDEQAEEGKPTLVEAWRLLEPRLGFAVTVDGDRAVRATGTVRGRQVSVDIEGRQRGSELLRSFADASRKRRNRVHELWWSELAVGCTNPAGLTGTVESFVDIEDPAWNPRNFDSSHCRVVRGVPASLGDRALTPSARERLAGLQDDVRIEVTPTSVRLASENKASLQGGWFVGIPFHVNYPNAPQPWPERAVAGPPWWIDLLVDLAEALDATRD